VSYAITNISRSSLSRLDRRSINGAVIGQSRLLPIHSMPCPLRLSLQRSAHKNFPYLQRLHGAIFSYPVCRACYVNLPRQGRRERLQASRIPQFHRRSRDGAVISKSCLRGLGSIVVERRSQLRGSSLSALEPRQIARKPRGRTALPAAACCAKDPRAALNR
jgi:hypothetical protein